MPNYQLIIFGVLIVVMFFMMSRSSKKARERMLQQQEEAVQVGKNVVTTSGFFGRVVDVDGDAVTLMTPSGDESVWLKSAIRGEAELPLAFIDDEDDSFEETSAQPGDESEGSAPEQNESK